MTLKTTWLAIGLVWLIALPSLWTARLAAPFFLQSDPPHSPSHQSDPPESEIETTRSPDGQWTAILNPAAGSLVMADHRHQQSEIFPAGSTVQQISWSPDSRRLLIVRTHWLPLDESSAISATKPLELWRLDLDIQRRTLSTPTLLYQAPQPDPTSIMALPQQAILGSWSPNSRHLLLGLSRLSASLLADGIPFWVLDTDTGQLHPVAHDARFSDESSLGNIALPNPRYHSWSPDGSMLAITVGGYRSAQRNKWLNLVEVTTGRVTTLVSRTEQIPGIVSWSPQGDWLAYAAIPAALSHEESADWLAFENPAIAERRIHLLNPTIGQHRRLNHQATYQDAPVWNSDGSALYYVARDGDLLKLRYINLHTGESQNLPDAVEPLDWAEPTRANVGYYGQFDREALLALIPPDEVGATAAGWVVNGYGHRQPVAQLPLSVGNEPHEPHAPINRQTDLDGHFVLTGLRSGVIRVRNSHLDFELPITSPTSTVDLGILHYPLVHPPPYYFWSAAPLPPETNLLTESQPISFTVCYTNPTWQRPSRAIQQAEVWSKPPFSQQEAAWLTAWFEQSAALYDSQALFAQSYPIGPRLDALTSDWRYLLGLWTDAAFPFGPDETGDVAMVTIPFTIPQIDCAYDGQALDELLTRKQLELWLLGYQATAVRWLDKAALAYDQSSLCDPAQRTCTERVGHHFMVQVAPASGYQLIRFPGQADVLRVHVLDQAGREVARLPMSPQ